MVHPFSNATEYMVWLEHNCCRCRKYHADEDGVHEPTCELEEALSLGTLTGEVTDDEARRMDLPRGRRCTEFEPEGLPHDMPHRKPAPGQLELFA